MNEINDTILIKFLNGECNEEELREISQWIKSSPDHEAELFRLEQVHREVAAAEMSKREVEQSLRRLHERLDNEAEQEKDAETPSPTVMALSPSPSRFRRRVMRVAAVFIGLVALTAAVWWFSGKGGAVFGPKMIVAEAVGTSPRSVALPDGSQVWLRPGSSLSYPENFAKKERRVELQGEGYFEVSHNARWPFVVSGDKADVRVLGTKFVFRIDSKANQALVSLIEGSVEVSDEKHRGAVVLKPGQRATLDLLNGRQTVENVNTSLDAVWHDKLIPFTNASTKDIARTLEQLYGVKVIVSEDVDEHHTFSGVVSLADNIDSVLSLISNTVPISYHRKGNTVWIEKEQ